MLTAVRSRTQFKHLKKVFSGPKELNAIVARMCVLYEDLRIEALGASAKSIEQLDKLMPTYRGLYFARRSTATLHEFIGAFKMLNQRPEFGEIRDKFDDEARQLWKDATDFFAANEELLTSIRQTAGGHLHHGTAEFVLEELHPDTYESIDLKFDHVNRVGGPRLKFANELVAIALQKRIKADGEDSKDFYNRILEVIWTSWRHVVTVVNIIVVYYLLERFE